MADGSTGHAEASQLQVERRAGEGDLRARELMEEARAMAANQVEIMRRLDRYEADRRAERLKAAPPPSSGGGPPELPVPERLETPPPAPPP